MTAIRRAARALTDGLARRPSLVVIGLVALSAAFVIVAGPMSSTTSWIVGGALSTIATVTLVVMVLNLAGRDPDAELRARSAFGDDPATVALLSRWLRRSRHFRFVGGLTGAVLGFGFISNDGWGPILVGALAGVTAGGMAAEVRLGRPRATGPRVAELTRRRVRDYADSFDLLALPLIGTVAVGLTAWSILDPGDSPGLTATAGAAAVVLAVALAQRLVAIRPRPALHPSLRQADEVMRRLGASQGFARPGIALAIVLVAVAAGRGGADTVALVLWLVGIGVYWSSRQSIKGLRGAIR